MRLIFHQLRGHKRYREASARRRSAKFWIWRRRSSGVTWEDWRWGNIWKRNACPTVDLAAELWRRSWRLPGLRLQIVVLRASDPETIEDAIFICLRKTLPIAKANNLTYTTYPIKLTRSRYEKLPKEMNILTRRNDNTVDPSTKITAT